jgi:hypothetical protein
MALVVICKGAAAARLDRAGPAACGGAHGFGSSIDSTQFAVKASQPSPGATRPVGCFPRRLAAGHRHHLAPPSLNAIGACRACASSYEAASRRENDSCPLHVLLLLVTIGQDRLSLALSAPDKQTNCLRCRQNCTIMADVNQQNVSEHWLRSACIL